MPLPKLFPAAPTIFRAALFAMAVGGNGAAVGADEGGMVAGLGVAAFLARCGIPRVAED